MMNVVQKFTLAVALFGLTVVLPAAEPVKIKLATLAPKDTSFHKSLLMMGQKWRDASAGQVSLTVYTDGTQGGEADMVRRMRIGQIHAAMLTVAGLLQIDDSVAGLQLMPMMIRDFNELDYVREKIRPMLEKKLADKGFVVLFWGDAGYVHFFSKQGGVRPDEFTRMKMFVWSGDSRSIEVMKTIGVNAIPLEQTGVLTGLQTGMIDVVPSVPIYALAGQFYSPAPHMLDINWVPLVGATVISKKVWDSIPAANRDAIVKAANEAGDQIKVRSRAESIEAVEAMKKRGLKVQSLTPAQLAEWYKFADSVYPKIRGKVVPADMFDEVQKLVAEYRKGK
jgi:TRAP-type C4-dicarboxylate transport system substrate-binding protein